MSVPDKELDEMLHEDNEDADEDEEDVDDVSNRSATVGTLSEYRLGWNRDKT
jgi:hypothetical protein